MIAGLWVGVGAGAVQRRGVQYEYAWWQLRLVSILVDPDARRYRVAAGMTEVLCLCSRCAHMRGQVFVYVRVCERVCERVVRGVRVNVHTGIKCGAS